MAEQDLVGVVLDDATVSRQRHVGVLGGHDERRADRLLAEELVHDPVLDPLHQGLDCRLTRLPHQLLCLAEV